MPPAESGARAIAFVVFEEDAHGRARALDGAKALLGAAPAIFFARANFKGDAERVLVHHRTEAEGPVRLIFVGGGASARATEETFRRAAAHATKAAADLESLALVLHKGSVAPEIQAAAMVEGSVLARYRFDRFSSKPRKADSGRGDLAVLAWNAESASLAAEGCRTGEASAAACVLARDLANLPGNACRPSDLADAARQVAKKEGLRCEVLDGAAMKRLAMGSLLSVNGGSAAPPRLIVLEFGKKKSGQETICVIGKGVTFDSGGISIKPALDMDKMRYDKSGGCATIGLMVAVARLEPRAHVVGIVPACENMPGNDATRPGDVVRAMNGKTIEVLNTDAEGRLILADAICFARERFAPDHIIDIATLTGACAATFGSHAAGMLGTDDRHDAGPLEGGRRDVRARLAAPALGGVRDDDARLVRRPEEHRRPEGGHDHGRGVPETVRRDHALGAPRHRGHRLRRRPGLQPGGGRDGSGCAPALPPAHRPLRREASRAARPPTRGEATCPRKMTRSRSFRGSWSSRSFRCRRRSCFRGSARRSTSSTPARAPCSREVLDGDGLIGFPLLLRRGPSPSTGTPQMAEVLGVGCVVDYETRDDGTSRIEVLGRWRARLVADAARSEFRRAKVTILPETELADADARTLHEGLCNAVRRARPDRNRARREGRSRRRS